MELLPLLPEAQQKVKSSVGGSGIVAPGAGRHDAVPKYLRDTLSKLSADTELHDQSGADTKQQVPQRSEDLKLQVCVCGNHFMPDSNFCRKCGQRRAPAPHKMDAKVRQLNDRLSQPAPKQAGSTEIQRVSDDSKVHQPTKVRQLNDHLSQHSPTKVSDEMRFLEQSRDKKLNDQAMQSPQTTHLSDELKSPELKSPDRPSQLPRTKQEPDELRFMRQSPAKQLNDGLPQSPQTKQVNDETSIPQSQIDAKFDKQSSQTLQTGQVPDELRFLQQSQAKQLNDGLSQSHQANQMSDETSIPQSRMNSKSNDRSSQPLQTKQAPDELRVVQQSQAKQLNDGLSRSPRAKQVSDESSIPQQSQINAKSKKRPGVDVPHNKSDEMRTTQQLQENHRHTNVFVQMKPVQVLSARNTSKHLETQVDAMTRGRSLELGALARELERLRVLLCEDMRIQFAELKELLQNGKIGSMVCHRCGGSDQKEVEHLREHCDKLLAMNAHLRQHDLNYTLKGLEKQMAVLNSDVNSVKADFQKFLESAGRQIGATGEGNSKLQDNLLSSVQSMFQSFSEGLKSGLVKELTCAYEKEHLTVKEEQQRLHTKVTAITQIINDSRQQQLNQNKHLNTFMEQQEELKDFVLQNRQQILLNEQRDEEIQMRLQRNEQLDEEHRMRQEANQRMVEENRKLLLENERRDEENRKLILENERRDEEYRQRLIENEMKDAEDRELDKQLMQRIQDQTTKLAEHDKHLSDQQLQARNVTEHMHKLEMRLKDSEDAEAEERTQLMEELARARDQRSSLFANIDKLRHESAESSLAAVKELETVKEQLRIATEELENRQRHMGHVFADKLIKVNSIEDRGNLRVNLKNGEVDILREIPYVPKMPADGPVAEYADDKQALEVISDIAEVWKLFEVQAVIEGHTKDLGTGSEKFWQELADNRAALCVSTLQDFNVDPSKVVAKGMPGKKGLNRPTVVVKLDIFDEHQQPQLPG